MKTLGSLLFDYIAGFVTSALILLTLSEIVVIANNILHFDIIYPIAYGTTMVIFVIFTPLGITYIAKTIKETKN